MIITPEGVKPVVSVRACEVLTPVTQATTASFVDVVGSKIDAAAYNSIGYTIANGDGANGLSWQVLGSIDDVTYVIVNASANVAFGASDKYTVSPAPYRFYKVQVKDQVAASHATGKVSVIGK